MPTKKRMLQKQGKTLMPRPISRFHVVLLVCKSAIQNARQETPSNFGKGLKLISTKKGAG